MLVSEKLRFPTPTPEELHLMTDGALRGVCESQLEVIEHRTDLDPDSYDYSVRDGLTVARNRRHNLSYAARTELEVVQTASSVETLLHGIDPDSHLGRFFIKWRTEEPFHGELIKRLIESINLGLSDLEAVELPAGVDESYNDHPFLTLMTSIPGVRDGVRLGYLGLGYIHESTTLGKYRNDIAYFSQTDEPFAKKIIADIAGQEPAHKYIYSTLYEMYHRQAGRLARLIGRYIVTTTFTPVGANTYEDKTAFSRLVRESGVDPRQIAEPLKRDALALLRLTYSHPKADFIINGIKNCLELGSQQAA